MAKAKPKEAPEDGGIAGIDVEYPDAGTRYPATVVRISRALAGEVFKDKAEEPDKPVIVVEFEGLGDVAGKAAISAPLPDPKTGKVMVRNPKSNLFRWVRKYKKGPHVGQKIDVYIDDKGFYRPSLE